ncbi:hypothetical protein, partial [Aeromonas bestiarum]|uniref:hypothetical protein n=1 Tax=Aeromonas bestiarum TaxID=105751 RepID=UPI0032B26A2D
APTPRVGAACQHGITSRYSLSPHALAPLRPANPGRHPATALTAGKAGNDKAIYMFPYIFIAVF